MKLLAVLLHPILLFHVNCGAPSPEHAFIDQIKPGPRMFCDSIVTAIRIRAICSVFMAGRWMYSMFPRGCVLRSALPFYPQDRSWRTENRLPVKHRRSTMKVIYNSNTSPCSV
ncbi:hypothetical protein J3A83DRAFT_24215 [Scleroderma citrinum]